MYLLVVGAGGLLGSNVVAAAHARGWAVAGTYHSGSPSLSVDLFELDVRETERFSTLLDRVDPDAVVNCAAATDVDACQQSPERARAVNAEAPGEMATVAAEGDVDFVHVSTDYVFDGADGPYAETDDPGPIQTYGETKLAGDRAVCRAHDRALVVRPSFLYGRHGATGALCGFPAWLCDRLEAGRETPLFVDQWVSPTRAGSAATALLDLLAAGEAGTYHVAGRTGCTPHEFGRQVADAVGLSTDPVVEGRRTDLDRPAPRPTDTRLRVDRVERALGEERPTAALDLAAIL